MKINPVESCSFQVGFLYFPDVRLYVVYIRAAERIRGYGYRVRHAYMYLRMNSKTSGNVSTLFYYLRQMLENQYKIFNYNNMCMANFFKQFTTKN